MTELVHLDDEMIERMEIDLADKAAQAFTAAGVLSNVYGVFSLDDLETKAEGELSRKPAVGVGYAGSAPMEVENNALRSAAPGQSSAMRMLSYKFQIILAVPTGPECLERYTATKLLTILRRRIHGAVVAGDGSQRRWNFQQERPHDAESTETLLYYSQTWQVSLPLVGPA